MKLLSTRAWIGILVAGFLIGTVPGAPADPLIRHAREREKAGDLESAAELFSSWLAANRGASGCPAVFGAYFRVEQNLPALLKESGEFLASARGVPGAAPQLEKTARLFDLAGRVEEARNAWLAAFAEGAPESCLVSAFLLSFQMNDTESMSATLEKLNGTSKAADLLLHAVAEIRKGGPTAARPALLEVAEQTASSELALKALWILHTMDTRSGDPAARAWSRSRLKARYGSSPETAIAAGPDGPGAKPSRAIVVEMATPVALDVAPAAPPTAAPAETALQAVSVPAVTPPAGTPPAAAAPTAVPPTADSPRTVSVQAGSFLMKENADDLVAVLAKRGFSPVVVRETIQGKERYRVLAAAGLEPERAKAVLKRLSDEGFRGFIVADR